MKPVYRLFQLFRSMRLAILLCSALLVSCGDFYTSAGIGGTGITSGEVTGFGSVFVNGVEFNTNYSLFDVDGDTSAMETALSTGMVVKITGTTDSNGLTGTADLVEYDDEIQGPVVNLIDLGGNQKSFEIFGQTVIIDQTSTSFDNTTFVDLQLNDIIEVSGFHAPNNEIVATFAKKIGVLVPGSSQVELKGTISGYTTTPTESFVLSDSGVLINVDSATVIDVPGNTLVDGLFVEVEGILEPDSSISATEIELEETSYDDIGEISLQGIISNFTDLSTPFTINGQVVDASAPDLELIPLSAADSLADGVNIEVEGSIVGGTLIADELELRQGSIKMRAFVFGKDLPNNTFEVYFPPLTGSITVTVDAQTRFEDDVLGLENFSLVDILVGDFVRVEAIDNNGSITASIVKRRNPDEIVLEGEVKDYLVDSWVNILDIVFSVNPATLYYLDDVPSSSSTFFDPDNPPTGKIVEIVDTDGDGIADRIEWES